MRCSLGLFDLSAKGPGSDSWDLLPWSKVSTEIENPTLINQRMENIGYELNCWDVVWVITSKRHAKSEDSTRIISYHNDRGRGGELQPDE